jgi:serine/threonine protein kinase
MAALLVEDGDCPAMPLPEEPMRLCAGTVGYMAPEVAIADRAAIGPATDLFLLGASLYAVLTGDPPYNEDSATACLEAAARNLWRRIDPQTAGVPAELVAAQERAMALLPSERGSVDDFAAALRSWLAR